MTKRFIIFLILIAQSITAQENSISAFVYHRFGDDRYPSTNIQLDQFEAHLKYLQDNGYQVLTLSEAIDLMSNKNSFAKAAVLTIDDGYSSFFENAMPLLRKYGFKATLFVNTETVGGGDFMNWDELKRIKAEGIEIGNHSHDHSYFLNKSEFDFENDLLSSEAQFLQHLGESPKLYAYPYGEWNESMANHLQKKGYLGAVAQNSGVMYRDAPQYHLPRFPMSESYAELEGFVSKLKTQPIKVTKYTPITTGSYGTPIKPRIDIEFKEDNLKLEQLQCFVQGAECKKSIQVIRGGLVKLNIRPDRDLKRRRTLFTITIPDNEGKWHWYSYSWVIPSVQ